MRKFWKTIFTIIGPGEGSFLRQKKIKTCEWILFKKEVASVISPNGKIIKKDLILKSRLLYNVRIKLIQLLYRFSGCDVQRKLKHCTLNTKRLGKFINEAQLERPQNISIKVL